MTQARETAVVPAEKASATFNADAVFKWITIGAALVVPIIMTGIFWELLSLSWLALKTFGWRFFITETWNPVTQIFWRGQQHLWHGSVHPYRHGAGSAHEYRHCPVSGGAGPPASEQGGGHLD